LFEDKIVVIDGHVYRHAEFVLKVTISGVDPVNPLKYGLTATVMIMIETLK